LPDFIYPAALSLSKGDAEWGILIDGAGFSSGMLANKLPNIKAAVCHDIFTARVSREHCNANVLCLGGKVIGEALALEMVKEFLNAKYLGGKYQTRLDKLEAISKNTLAPQPDEYSVITNSEQIPKKEGDSILTTKVITEEDIKKVASTGSRSVSFMSSAIITNLARETASALGIKIEFLK